MNSPSSGLYYYAGNRCCALLLGSICCPGFRGGGGARTGKHTMRARTSAGTSCKPTLFTNATRTSQASARKNVPTSTGVCSLVTLTSNGRLKVYANRGFTIFWAPSPVSIFMAESRVDPRDRATFVKIVCILPVRFWV